jgi:hypothetical protein
MDVGVRTRERTSPATSLEACSVCTVKQRTSNNFQLSIFVGQRLLLLLDALFIQLQLVSLPLDSG